MTIQDPKSTDAGRRTLLALSWLIQGRQGKSWQLAARDDKNERYGMEVFSKTAWSDGRRHNGNSLRVNQPVWQGCPPDHYHSLQIVLSGLTCLLVRKKGGWIDFAVTVILVIAIRCYRCGMDDEISGAFGLTYPMRPVGWLL